jgi:hypothetical protein
MTTMAQDYGIQAQVESSGTPELPPVRYLVLIDSASNGGRLARLYLASHQLVAEFDAGAPEVQLMTRGLASTRCASQPQWDDALAGNSKRERATAEVFTLDV